MDGLGCCGLVIPSVYTYLVIGGRGGARGGFRGRGRGGFRGGRGGSAGDFGGNNAMMKQRTTWLSVLQNSHPFYFISR